MWAGGLIYSVTFIHVCTQADCWSHSFRRGPTSFSVVQILVRQTWSCRPRSESFAFVIGLQDGC